MTSLDDMRTELDAIMSSFGSGLPAANRLCVACVDMLGVDGAAISMVYDGFSHGTFGASGDASRRLDEYQFTFGEGPCLDAASSREAVLVPDLDLPHEQRWPAFTGAVLEDGIRAVFALPIMITSVCVGALDLFREAPGPLTAVNLAGGRLAAGLATGPLLDLIASTRTAGSTNDANSLDDDNDGDDGDGGIQLADLDRIEVYQATGVLISQLDVDPAEALVRLRAHAISTGQTASEAARAILEHRLVLERDDRGDVERGR